MSDSDPVPVSCYVPLTAVPTAENLRDARQAWRAYRASGPGSRGETISVGIAASVTADPIEPFLGAALLRQGREPALALAPFNRLFQVCIEGVSEFACRDEALPLDAIVLYWRMDELLGQELVAFSHGDDDALGRACDTVDQWAGAVRGLRKRFAGSLLVNTPPFPQDLEVGLRDLNNPQAAARFHHRVSEHWREAIAPVEGVDLYDADAVQRELGLAQCADPRKWLLYRQPYSEIYWLALAEEIARVLHARRTPAKKCIALDCDNTLWGGILGEDGIGGLQLGEDFPGSAFRMFQRQLLALQQRGVLLVLVSKNNEADVLNVLDKHDAMVLRREHIAGWRINWSPKSENLRALAKELNIATDAMVFIDDQPTELAEVRFQCPEIVRLQVPEELAELPQLLRHHRIFDQLAVTSEDRQRTTMIQANRERSALEQRQTREAFLASLQLQVRIQRAAPAHLNRVAQLINKTNQFNLTTRRRTLDEVHAVAESPDYAIYTMEASDRFGSYGLIAVAIVQLDGTQARLDTFLMSCRVLGRSLETAFLARIGQELIATGAVELCAEFIPTPSNAPVADLLPRHGFSERDGAWHIGLAALPPLPEHVRLG